MTVSSPCSLALMASRGDEVATAENHHEIVNVADLLPGPIWHIIFCHVLLGPSHEGRRTSRFVRLLNRLKNKLQNRSNHPGASQQEAGSTSGATGSGLLSRLKNKLQNWGNSSEKQQAEALRTFGSCWPLLRCAMVCKRLLYHVASFSDLEPMTLPVNTQDPALTRPSGTLSVFLRHAPHTPLNVVLNSPQDLHCLGRLLGPSARSLTNLCIRLKEPLGGVEPIVRENQLMNPAFLEEFEQLQRLKLGRGTWQLGNLNPARFRALRSLSINDFDCDENDLSFLSSIAPQLHELALASSSRGSGSTTLEFKLTAARGIALRFHERTLHLRFTLPASLKTFVAFAASINVDCTCPSPLSLDTFGLIGRSQLLVSLLPLASAKFAFLDCPNNQETEVALRRQFPTLKTLANGDRLYFSTDFPFPLEDS
ncbi:unnamed protein product [Closterium sp. Yama58-4]|nr:unnamed protein product [Closterium sp. Yama58-4]